MKERCQLFQRGALNSMRASIFVFRSKKIFFNISISGVCTGKREVSTVLKRCPKQCATIFFSVQICFFDISISGDCTGEREVTAVLTWCPEPYANIFVF